MSNPWHPKNQVPGLVTKDDDGVEWVCVDWRDITQEYWETYDKVWMVDGHAPMRFNGSQLASFAKPPPAEPRYALMRVVDAVKYTRKYDPPLPEWGEVCL